ncbi:hypothetical protein, partial [Escherichia coli]|uniref:hypothetical protein n=1 Tax=Escherichia coli TaxID=562 RepID=UPI001928E3C5
LSLGMGLGRGRLSCACACACTGVPSRLFSGTDTPTGLMAAALGRMTTDGGGGGGGRKFIGESGVPGGASGEAGSMGISN